MASLPYLLQAAAVRNKAGVLSNRWLAIELLLVCVVILLSAL